MLSGFQHCLSGTRCHEQFSSVTDCLFLTVSEMIYTVSSGMLNSTIHTYCLFLNPAPPEGSDLRFQPNLE